MMRENYVEPITDIKTLIKKHNCIINLGINMNSCGSNTKSKLVYNVSHLDYSV